MAQPGSRANSDWARLCTDVQQYIPTPFGQNAWELVIAAALVASPEPELLAQFYTYLSQHDPAFETEDEKKRLSLRFRDTCFKLMTLVGSPRIISALIPLAKAEGNREEKAAQSVLNPKWQNVDAAAIHARGVHTINTIYGDLLPRIFRNWGDHSQDLQYNAIFTGYGLYFSDFEFMTPLEAEAVVFTSISCTGLRLESLWHTRGMGRLLGARGGGEDNPEMRSIKDMLRNLKTAMMTVVDWVGPEYVRRAQLDQWVNVDDVERELNGWGDDPRPT